MGIVEKVENGIVYTVEGNLGDSCCENHYVVVYYYGVPQYKNMAKGNQRGLFLWFFFCHT